MNDSFNLGLAAYCKGDFEEAAELLKNAAAADPGNANYLYYLGCALEKTGKTEEAVGALSKALERADAVPIRYQRAELFLNAGKTEEACADFDHIIRQAGEADRYFTALSLLGRGLILLESEDIEGALADFTAAEDIAEKEGDASLKAHIAATLEKNGF